MLLSHRNRLLVQFLGCILTVTADPSWGQDCTVNTHSASYWLVDYTVGALCFDSEKQWLNTALTRNAVNHNWASNPNSPGVPETGGTNHFVSYGGPPEIPINLLVPALGNKGFVHIMTHGKLGGFGVEFYYLYNDAKDALDEYERGSWQYGELEVRPCPGCGDMSQPDIFYVGVTPTGIYNKVNNSDDAFVYANYSEGFIGKSQWDYGVFVGYEITPGATSVACPNFQALFARMNCNLFRNQYEWLDNDVQSAVDGNNVVPSLPYLKRDPASPNFALWRFTCGYGCYNIAARFARCGAFQDKAWTAVDQYGSVGFEVLGFKTNRDWPDRGIELRAFPAHPGDGRKVYIENGLPLEEYALFCFVEIDEHGLRTRSDPFRISEQPRDWDLLGRFDNNWSYSPIGLSHFGEELREVWQSGTGRTAGKMTPDSSQTGGGAARRRSLQWSPQRADVAVFSSDLTLLEAEADNLIALGYGVRTFLGDGSVAQAQQVAALVRQDNIEYNDWCAEQPPGTCMMVSEEPPLALVGDPSAGLIELGSFPDPHEEGLICQHYGVCVAFGASGNLFGTQLEDVPVYLVPATTAAEIDNLAASALRYEQGSIPGSRALLLVGDRLEAGHFRVADETLEPLRNALMAVGMPKRELHQRDYPDVGSEAAREQAFVDEVNGMGTTLIAGFGHPTGKQLWPGGFINDWNFDWQGRLTRPQTAVGLLPGCYIVGEQFDDHHDPCLPKPCETPTQVKKGLFASPSGTTLAFATGHVNGAPGAEYELWVEFLSLAFQDAPVGTPWPRIVWDAKQRAVTQYPWMERYVRSIGSLGTMVRKAAAVLTAVEETGENYSLGLRVMRSDAGATILRFSLPRTDHATITIFDVRGRSVASIYSGRTPAGLHQVTWNERDGSGVRVASSVYLVKLSTAAGETATAKIVLVR